MITPLAENLWLLPYPLPKLGADLRRNVTVIRLPSGSLVIHSTGPFTPADVAAISALGQPKWIVDTMLHHDTFAKEGRAAFPELSYLAPSGFSAELSFPTGTLLPAPPEWEEVLPVIKIDGMPTYEEHVFFHAPTRTLITADLVFNFGPDEPLWTELLLKVAVGSEHGPGIARPFKAGIEDRAAFQESLARILALDFDRIVPGHGDVIETGGKAQLIAALEGAELLPG